MIMSTDDMSHHEPIQNKIQIDIKAFFLHFTSTPYHATFDIVFQKCWQNLKFNMRLKLTVTFHMLTNTGQIVL